jgi:hypothetical protein
MTRPFYLEKNRWWCTKPSVPEPLTGKVVQLTQTDECKAFTVQAFLSLTYN